MGFLRKTLYTIIGLPTAAIGAEYFYTIKCIEVDPTDRLIQHSPLIATRISQNNARLDRIERVVPLSSLTATSKTVDESALARQLAKQVWLSAAYAPQRAICEQVFKKEQEKGANLTVDEIKRAKVEAGFDVSQHLFVSDILGSYIQFVPKIPDGVDFQGPGGVVSFDVSRRGEDVVFAIECASVGLATQGSMPVGDWLQFYLHKMYARLLLEAGVRRVLHGEGE
jgi:hypothetical protein